MLIEMVCEYSVFSAKMLILPYIKICDFYAHPIRKEQFFRGNIIKSIGRMDGNWNCVYIKKNLMRIIGRYIASTENHFDASTNSAITLSFGHLACRNAEATHNNIQ